MNNNFLKFGSLGTLLLVFFFIFLNLYFSEAAPRPWGIALNNEAKQCAGYWGGDEFTQYSLPEGWQEYYFDKELREGLTVDDCLVTSESGDYDYQNCCDKMGYEYISENIGEDLATTYDDYDTEEEREIRESTREYNFYYVLGLGLVFVVFLIVLAWYLVIKRK